MDNDKKSLILGTIAVIAVTAFFVHYKKTGLGNTAGLRGVNVDINPHEIIDSMGSKIDMKMNPIVKEICLVAVKSAVSGFFK